MSKTERIRELVIRDIRGGRFLPGARLPTRHEMMKEHGLARASVDKIIRQLCNDGWLFSVRGSGTFVANLSGRDRLSIYVVLNTEVECMSSNFMERHWNFLVNELEIRRNTVILGCHELERFMPAILKDHAARVVWNRPAMSSYRYISRLQSLHYLQILVNRPLPQYNYIASDTHSGLKKVLSHVHRTKPGAVIGIIPAVVNPIDYYLTEREAYFYELANFYGLKPVASRRVERSDQGAVMEASKSVLLRKPDFLYVPDYYMTTSVSAVLHQHGSSTTLITSDWNETPGVICLQQNWKEVCRQVLVWISQEHPPRIQYKVETEVLFP